MYALVDFDPDGLAIMLTYKHGSIARIHEVSSLAVPQIRWLGLQSSDLLTLQGSSADPVNAASAEVVGLLPLTARDRRKAISMIRSGLYAEDANQKMQRRELQVMLMLGIKAEIQVLDQLEGGFERWLRAKLHHY